MISISLITHAIILYVRSTTSDGGRRQSGEKRVQYNIRGKLNRELQSIHDEIVVLRDKALAHFGDGNLSRSLSFAEDNLVLVGDTGRPRIHCLTKRGNIGLSIGLRLQKLLTEAISILVVASQEKAIAANKAVIDAVNNGILTFEELDQCHIDYFNLHPNEESAWDALANMDREHHFGHGIGSLD